MNERSVILVTGANGQLGMEFRDLESSYPDFEFIFVSRERLSVEDAQAVDRFFADHHIDYCVNCAAYTAVDKAESERDVAFSGNAKAPEYLALATAKHKAAFFHFSTDYVFNGQATEPYKEDQDTDPINVYGESKREGELLVLKANPQSVVLRTSWVYSRHGKNFVKTMQRLMAEKTEISVVNDQVGSPTYARDLAAAVMQIISTHKPSEIIPGIFNYSNLGVISWFEFAEAIKEILDLDCKINPVPATNYPTPAKRPAYSVMDTSKIREVYKIQIPDWKSSLKSCLS